MVEEQERTPHSPTKVVTKVMECIREGVVYICVHVCVTVGGGLCDPRRRQQR